MDEKRDIMPFSDLQSHFGTVNSPRRQALINSIKTAEYDVETKRTIHMTPPMQIRVKYP